MREHKIVLETFAKENVSNDMYYANSSRSWHGSAVPLLDISKSGMAYGRAYKIKKNQLKDIHGQEGPEPDWYPDCV